MLYPFETLIYERLGDAVVLEVYEADGLKRVVDFLGSGHFRAVLGVAGIGAKVDDWYVRHRVDPLREVL